MELIFGAAFLAALRLVAPVAVFLTEKVKDILNATGKAVSYLISFITSALITLLIKLVGPTLVWMMLSFVPGFPGGEAPVIPETASNAFYIVFAIVLFLTAGGIYDFEKRK